ncbi:MAG: STAS domain-containing protein [Ignavibacteriaceae bacterium]|nr:STAS domain-containing protein [Ignavibacteriaceae bacterium]
MRDFELNTHCGYLIATVKSEKATILEALEFKSILDEKIYSGHHNIVIDLQHCEFMDSTFIGVLVVTWKKVKSKGGKLKLVKPGNFAQTVFHLTGTVEIFETYDSVEEALSSFIIPIEDYSSMISNQKIN